MFIFCIFKLGFIARLLQVHLKKNSNLNANELKEVELKFIT